MKSTGDESTCFGCNCRRNDVPGDQAMLISLGMMITGANSLEDFVGMMCHRHRVCLDEAMEAHLRRIDGAVT